MRAALVTECLSGSLPVRARFLVPSIVFVTVCAGSCEGGGLPEGIGQDTGGDGPIVKFDLFARPLPEVPLPNDLATRPDPGSPTGRRLNASHVATTGMESGIRTQLDWLDGWGTYSPISVAFECEGEPDGICLDIDNLVARHPRGDFAFDDDVLYVVDVTRGSPTFGRAMPVDIGQGHFPLSVVRTDSFYDNDTRQGSTNIVFEEVEEPDIDGDGQPDPAEDLNGDGRLGRPNEWPEGSDAADGLYTGYEFESNTLLMRPLLPLRETTTYAVILTDRLTDDARRPVRSPFPSINHVEQTADLEPLAEVLAADPDTFGGIGMADVRFAWTFTTQSVTADLKALRRGLYGEGPFSRLSEQYPPDLVANQLWGCNPFGTGTCDLPANLFTLKIEDLAPILGTYAETLLTEDPEDVNALLDTFLFVDYAIVGHYYSPNFLDSNGDGVEQARWQSEDLDGDGRLDVSEDTNFNDRIDEGEDTDGDGHLDRGEDENGNGRLDVVHDDEGVWKMNHVTGQGEQSPGWVSVFITVPKEAYRPEPGEPFPVVFYGHGYTSFNLEVFGFAGTMARFGFATVAVKCVHHRLGLE